jgi:hypothetical protein
VSRPSFVETERVHVAPDQTKLNQGFEPAPDRRTRHTDASGNLTRIHGASCRVPHHDRDRDERQIGVNLLRRLVHRESGVMECEGEIDVHPGERQALRPKFYA